MPITFGRLALPALLALLFWSNPARACNVPVFRFALERWPADTYEVIVFHRGPLAPADKALTDALAKHTDADPARVNVILELVDLAKRPEKARLKLYESLKSQDLPLLVVRYPNTARIHEDVWAGRLTPEVARGLLDSPARREVVRRIVSGDSAVWILLEGGDRAKDDAAATLLQGELAKLEKELKLPQLTDDPEDKLAAKGPPLKLAFSLLRVRRNDPAERLLVKMLTGLEPELTQPKYRDKPMAFAVFGRGRGMLPLVGAGITAPNILEVAQFLTGPCTCKVKEQNPGVDLLFAADWTAPADQQPTITLSTGDVVVPLPPPPKQTAPPPAQTDPPAPALVQPEAIAPPRQSESPQQPPPAQELTESGSHTLLVRNLLLAAAGGVVLVGLVSFLLIRKSKGLE